MKKNVEEIYQKKSQIEHILIRPDTYIGATNPDLQPMFVWDDSAGAIIKKNISFSPGLYKIFDEILVNAADNKERDARMTEIRIGLDRVLNRITIFNDGSGIPILIHKVENIYIPSLIFGHLLTSSNFDDSERKVVGGRNGFGAKLCNIFSHKFILETGSKSDHKSFEQIWENNMSTAHAPKINEHYHGKDFTRITFYPDLKRFNMTEFDEDFIGLVKRRAVDLAGTTKNIKVFYNDILIKINNFEQYSKLYINKNNINNFIADNNDNFDNKLKSAKIVNKNNNLDNISNNNINIDNFNNNVKNNNLNIDKNNDNFNSNKDSFNFDKFNDNDTKYFYSKVNDRWEIVVCPSDGSFQHISFVNSIATTKGGTHVNHVTNKITARLIEDAQKKIKNNKIILRQPQIKQHFWIFINCKIENPSFDSQTKENLTLNEKEFGSSCDISDKFMKKISDCLIENVISFINIKLKNELSKKGATVKRAKLHGLAKLDDANDAGTAKSRDCTLILTEGDSAKSLAVAGVAVVGRDKFGVFPLRGKVLNIRDVPVTTVIKNKEVENLVKIIGLDYKKKYEDISQLSSLRYGKVMFMTDQDFDGSHIKGLLINFFHFLWPNLIKNNFLEQFITPIVKVRKGSNVLSFYSIPEYEEWKKNTSDYKSYKIKYYKGLGTSSSIEAREYFEDLNRHRIRFKYSGQDCDDAINLAFSKNKSDSRKLWLDRFQEESSRRKEFGLPDVYLYHKDTSIVTYSDFVNKELILFSHSDNIRSIPSMIDGLKPGQRKVIFTALKKKIKDIKVFQLAGAVSEVSAYHHGETSLISTIINLAQNFVGSNNINLLNPDGQFGTRIKGGKDASAARYISTGLNFITRHIFLASDDPILNYLYEDNQLIEPDFYFPVIPMVLVNGADGIGTGYSTKIPCYDPRQIIYNLKLMLNNEEPQKMVPWFKNFTGQITEISSDKVLVTGRAYHAGQDSVVVSELPIRVWTETYKESVLEPLVKVDNSSENYVLADYKDYHDESNIHYVLKFKPGYLDGKDDAFLSNLLKLQTTISLSQLVLFDDTGKLHRYNSVIDILKDFFRVRLKKYEHRKRYLEALLAAEFLKIDSQVRFIDEKIRGVIVIENRKRKEMIVVLKAGKYPSDPVKTFFLREGMNRMQQEQTGEVFAENTNENQGENAVETQEDDANDYEYLLGMPLWSLTYERQEKLKEARKKKEDEFEALKKKTPHKLWEDDLDSLTAALDKLDEEEIKLKTTIKKKTNVKKIKTPIRTRDIDCQQVLEGKKIGGLVAVKALNEGNNNEDPLTEDDPLRKETQKQLFKKVTKVPKEPKVKGEKKPKGEKKERKPKAEKGEKKERKPKSEKGEKKEKKPKASKKEKSEDGSSVSEKISEKKAPVKRTKAPQESTEKKAKKSKKLDTTDEITIRSESEMENVDPAPGIKAVRAKAVTKKYVESDPESEEKTFTPDSDVFAISDED